MGVVLQINLLMPTLVGSSATTSNRPRLTTLIV